MKQANVSGSVELLDRDLAGKNLQGHWRLGLESNPPYPVTSVQPCLWKWADVHESFVRAAEVVSLEHVERRTIRLINPGLKDRNATSHTIQMSVQYVEPGEYARAHRHTAAALRFVLRGHGAYTTVNGQQCMMDEGDLILTPQLNWHDHTNNSDKPIVWLDGLDLPLVQLLQQLVFEPYGQSTQPIVTSSERVAALYGYTRPTVPPTAEFFHYKWRNTYQILRALTEAGTDPDRFDGYILEFRHPVTGGPTMPTIQCALQLLRPGHETRAHRHTSTVIYHAYRGCGTSFIGDQRFDWDQGDLFVVPLWYPHCHVNRSSSEEAILFSMSDAPVLKSLDLYREEAVGK
jgi:gentisate 1,2-dioxygenase